MAKFKQTVGLDDFVNSLSSLDMEYIAPQALTHAAPIVKNKLERLSEPHSRTGAMAKSIKTKKPSKTKNGDWQIFTGPQGTDKNGVRNMEKMAYLEYGVRAHKQPATPVITPAVESTHDKVVDDMQETFNKTLDDLNL